MRKLLLEKLDSRLCMAFGDVVADFAESGQYAVSYDEIDRRWSPFLSTFSYADGYLRVAHTEAGSGVIFTLAKVDLQGRPDPTFGNNGLIQFIDSSAPISGISHAIQLSDGGLLLRTSSKSVTSYLKLHSDGSVDTSFGDNGYVRATTDAGWTEVAVVADHSDGFYVALSHAQNFNTTLWHYHSDGQLDTGFGNAGKLVVPYLFNMKVFIDSAGSILLAGIEARSSNLGLVVQRFQSSGAADLDFGVGGRSNLAGADVGTRYQFINDGSQLLVSRAAISGSDFTIEVSRYSNDLKIDSGFGDKGTTRLVTALGQTDPSSVSVVSGTDGISIVSGKTDYIARRSNLRIQKLSLDGQLDTAFGTNGVVIHQINQLLTLAVVQSDGRGGVLWHGWTQPVTNANYLSDSYVIHTLSNGQLDQDWGTNGLMLVRYTPASQTINLLQLDPLGAGAVRLTSGWPTYGAADPNIGRADTLDASGKIVQSAEFGRAYSQLYTASAPAIDGGWFIAQAVSDSQGLWVEITRFLSDGRLNTTFGEEGVMRVQVDALTHIFMRASRDGSIAIAAGSYATQSDPSTSRGVAVIVRINADGTPDENFGPAGVQRLYQKSGNIADVLVDPKLGTLLVIDPWGGAGLQLQLFRDDGTVDTNFGDNGISTLSGEVNWRSGEIDELGRILVVTQQQSFGQAYRLYQFDTQGKLVTGFGTAGSMTLPIEYNATLDAASLSLRHGVIAVAATHRPQDNVIRLLAYDYAGKPLTELDTDGIRDYDLANDGVIISDLAFADDGSLWMATSQRHGFDQIGTVIKLGGSESATNHNWNNGLDTNNDQHTTALDALLVISALNGFQPTGDMLLDVNADTRVTAIDALMIINELNAATAARPRQSLPGGEGESSPIQTTGAVYSAEALADVDQLNKRRRS